MKNKNDHKIISSYHNLDDDEKDHALFSTNRNSNDLLSTIGYYNYVRKEEEIEKYFTNNGLANFYKDIQKFEVDKLIAVLEDSSIIELFKIIDRITTDIQENYFKINTVTNRLNEFFAKLELSLIDKILILQGIKEWLNASELIEKDVVNYNEILNVIYENQKKHFITYFFNDFLNAKLNPFTRYIKSLNIIEDTIDIAFPQKVYPTINIHKYNPDEIFRLCDNKKIFKCKKDVFDKLLVRGYGKKGDIKIEWLFDNKNKRQLKFFINEMTGVKVSVKHLNLMFDGNVDSDNRKGKLNEQLQTILTLSNSKNFMKLKN